MNIRFALILFCSTLFGVEEITSTPALTGSLLAPTGTVITQGQTSVQPYLYLFTKTGQYNSDWHAVSTPNYYTLGFQVFTVFGLTEWMDIQLTPTVMWNSSQGTSRFRAGDFPVGLDFQIVSATAYKYAPGLKFTVRETFPTGKYDRLNVDNNGTDVGGFGTLTSQLNAVLYKVYHLGGKHYLSATLSYAYNLSNRVEVEGVSVYGGNENTYGTVYPGNSSTSFFSFEYTFDEHWAFAMDTLYQHDNKQRFKGETGGANMTAPSSEGLSFAPAIEYNLDTSLGVIAGAWISAAGRNSPVFRNFIISVALNY